jgi:hypothetical protein
MDPTNRYVAFAGLILIALALVGILILANRGTQRIWTDNEPNQMLCNPPSGQSCTAPPHP